MAEIKESKPTQTNAEEIQVKILFVVKTVKSFEKIEQFLARRGWVTKVVDNMAATIQSLVEETPDFVMVSVSHPSPKVLKLPVMLSQTFNTVSIAFAEQVDKTTRQKLDQIKSQHKMVEAPSGPAIHRKIKMILMEQQGSKDEGASQGAGGVGTAGKAESDLVKVTGNVEGADAELSKVKGSKRDLRSSQDSMFGEPLDDEATGAVDSENRITAKEIETVRKRRAENQKDDKAKRLERLKSLFDSEETSDESELKENSKPGESTRAEKSKSRTSSEVENEAAESFSGERQENHGLIKEKMAPVGEMLSSVQKGKKIKSGHSSIEGEDQADGELLLEESVKGDAGKSHQLTEEAVKGEAGAKHLLTEESSKGDAGKKHQFKTESTKRSEKKASVADGNGWKRPGRKQRAEAFESESDSESNLVDEEYEQEQSSGNLYARKRKPQIKNKPGASGETEEDGAETKEEQSSGNLYGRKKLTKSAGSQASEGENPEDEETQESESLGAYHRKKRAKPNSQPKGFLEDPGALDSQAQLEDEVSLEQAERHGLANSNPESEDYQENSQVTEEGEASAVESPLEAVSEAEDAVQSRQPEVIEKKSIDPHDPAASDKKQVDEALNDSLTKLTDHDVVEYFLTTVSGGWAYPVRGKNIDGCLLLVGSAPEPIPSELLGLFKTDLDSILKNKNQLVQLGEAHPISFAPTIFHEWAKRYPINGKLARGRAEIGAILVDDGGSAFVKPEKEGDWLKIQLQDLDESTPLRFDVHLFLKENNKQIIYVKKGSVFTGKQKANLMKHKVENLLIRADAIGEFERYLLEKIINVSLQKLIQSNGETTDSNSLRILDNSPAVEASKRITKTG